MVNAFLESNLMFMDDEGNYELEGSLDSLRLPTNVSESIRLRIEAVQERDPHLNRLLQLTAVMGGSFNLKTITPAWLAIGGEAAHLNDTIHAGVAQRLFKYMTSSGQASGQHSQRRRSSAAHVPGRWVFHHLRIQDMVRQLLPPEEARRMHRACAECLEGLVESSAWILHHEQAGNHSTAAKLLCEYTVQLREQGFAFNVVAATCQRCITCVHMAAPEPLEAVELRVTAMLMSTWILTPPEMAKAHKRFQHLMLQPACRSICTPTEIFVSLVTKMFSSTIAWNWWDIADSEAWSFHDKQARREEIYDMVPELTSLLDQEYKGYCNVEGGPVHRLSLMHLNHDSTPEPLAVGAVAGLPLGHSHPLATSKALECRCGLLARARKGVGMTTSLLELHQRFRVSFRNRTPLAAKHIALSTHRA